MVKLHHRKQEAGESQPTGRIQPHKRNYCEFIRLQFCCWPCAQDSASCLLLKSTRLSSVLAPQAPSPTRHLPPLSHQLQGWLLGQPEPASCCCQDLVLSRKITDGPLGGSQGCCFSSFFTERRWEPGVRGQTAQQTLRQWQQIVSSQLVQRLP